MVEEYKFNKGQSMSRFISFGSNYNVISDEDVKVYDQLPPRTYIVTYDEPRDQYGLSPIDDFTIPSRLYGTTEKDAQRILGTFMDRSSSTGVHLSGIKGSGKTLLAKMISYKAMKEFSFPTIVINQPYHGDTFNKFIQAINTPAVILFDEFEKVYDYSNQDKILTLLDGVYQSKKLFIVTSNDQGRISTYLRNRPGRIYYSLTFNSIAPEFVREYCEENLNDQEQTPSIQNYVSAYTFFSFDMLAAIVEEMNRYDQTLLEVLQFLNIEPESSPEDSHSVYLMLEGEEEELLVENEMRGFQPSGLQYTIDPDDLEDKASERAIEKLKALTDQYGWINVQNPAFVSFDPSKGEFVFEITNNNHRARIRFERNEDKRFDYTKYIC